MHMKVQGAVTTQLPFYLSTSINTTSSYQQLLQFFTSSHVHTKDSNLGDHL